MPDTIPADELIAAAADERFGQPPATGTQPQQSQPQPNNPPKETSQEAAVKDGSPKDESDLADDSPVEIEVPWGDGQTRKMTPAQIKATFERYADNNFRWQNEVAPMKPVLEYAKKVLEVSSQNGQEVSPDQLVQFLDNAARAFTQNPTMGNVQPKDAPKRDLSDDDLTKWEEENEVALPPGYRESAKQMNEMRQMLSQTQQMLQQVLQGQSGVANAAKDAQMQARDQRTAAIKNTIGNNLNAAQQQFGLQDDDYQDFQMFAGQRGYTMEDFVDPGLTMSVVQDFVNAKNSPEMERLRQIAAKRQAYTGSVEGAPSSGPAQAPTGAEKDFQDLAAFVEQQKNPNAM